MTDSTEERIARALSALSLTGDGDGRDIASAIRMLLGDLSHVADRHGLNFDILMNALRCDREVAVGEFSTDNRKDWRTEDTKYGDEYEAVSDEFELVDGDCENESPVGRYSFSERQARPLAEQSLDDFDEFFRSCNGITFIFLVAGEVNTVFPDIVSAIQLAECNLRGVNFKPAFEEEFSPQPTDALGRREIASEIRDRAEEMNRRGVEYCFIWNICGDGEIHVDGSDDMLSGDQVGWLLVDEVRELFQCW